MTPTFLEDAQGNLSGRFSGFLALAIAVAGAMLMPLVRPVLPVDETRYLTVAWEMHRDGNLIVPHLNGAIYGHKPPLLFWLINLVWSVTGASETPARMVAPAFGVLAVVLTWRLGDRLFSDRPGVGGRAALILSTTGMFALYGSLTMFDTMLASATLIGILALLRLDAGGEWLAMLAFGTALAFGVLGKGPVILVHLMPVALTRPIWKLSVGGPGTRDWYRLIASGFGIGLALVAVWIVPAALLGGPEYRAEVLWRQSAGRMMNAFDHARPFWFFAAILLPLLWPWAWRPAALRGLFTRGLWGDRRARMLGVWGVGTVILFSLISGKQLHYLVPAMPVAALALAASPAPKRGWGPLVPYLVIVLPVVVWAMLLATGQAQLDGTSVHTLEMSVLTISVALAIAGAVAIALVARKAPLLGWASVAPVTMLVVHVCLWPVLWEHFDTARFAPEIARAREAGIAIFGVRYQGEFGFTSRMTSPIEVLDEAGLEGWAAAHPGGLVITTRDSVADAAKVGEGWLAGDHLKLFRLR